MPSRRRERAWASSQGTKTRYLFGSYFNSSTRTPLGSDELTDDVVGEYPDPNPFYNHKMVREYALINGGIGNKATDRSEWSNWPVNGDQYPNTDPLSISLPSADVANILARSNPNRPSVSLPVFVAELKDLPGMIRHAGRLVRTKARELLTPKGAAEANLAYQFGMAPLFGDISKMLDFTQVVQRKRDELERLHSKGGLKRRVRVGEASVSWQGAEGLIEWDPEIRGYYTKETTGTRWATVRWLPDYTLIPSASDLDREAWMLAFGLHLSISDLWELLPWSWLIDWFTNFGDILMSQRNHVPVFPSNLCVMTQTRTVTTCVATSGLPQGVTMSGTTKRTFTTQERSVPALVTYPSASLPFLGAGQLSILASLSVLSQHR